MAHGVKTGGRQKGTPNKINAAARNAISLAADKLGGTRRIVSWAKEDPLNERAFWTSIYPKLIPVQLTGDPDAPIEINEAPKSREVAKALALILAKGLQDK